MAKNKVKCPYHKKDLTLEKQKDGSVIAVCRCKRDKYNGRVVVKKIPPIAEVIKEKSNE